MSSVVLESKNITLVETLDRVLNKGVILSGDITISVADVDLIFVGLKVLLASVETAEKMRLGYKNDRWNGKNGETKNENTSPSPLSPPVKGGEFMRGPSPLAVASFSSANPPECGGDSSRRGEGKGEGRFSEQPKEIKAVLPRIDAEPEKVEQGLSKLVLTLIDLLRKLMEKQAIRRIDGGSLSDNEVEKLGYTFMRLENKMEELKKVFGLKDEDLNLNLGPLGDLM
ncbi:MAG: gas vesicle protein K [Nitrospirae bacterium]|nr:gas vesicle protein K [Nitrospirota bacterium]